MENDQNQTSMIMFHVNLQGGMFYQLTQKEAQVGKTKRFIPAVDCIVVAVPCVFVHQKWPSSVAHPQGCPVFQFQKRMKVARHPAMWKLEQNTYLNS